jgi:type III pantothenate kinase
VAAYCIYKSPAIVVDLGTATNFEVISEKGEYLGGAIAPGIDTSAKSLFQKAAQLSKINLKMPERAIGKTTEECLRSGIILGAIGQIEKIVDEIKSEFSRTHKVSKEKIEVIGTGGLVDFVSKQTKCFDFVDKELALKGLLIIYNFIKNEEICNKMS